jgi:hypothetical protein
MNLSVADPWPDPAATITDLGNSGRGGAGGGGGEALGAALDRDEALPRQSPVGRFLPFVAPHLAPHR